MVIIEYIIAKNKAEAKLRADFREERKNELDASVWKSEIRTMTSDFSGTYDIDGYKVTVPIGYRMYMAVFTCIR